MDNYRLGEKTMQENDKILIEKIEELNKEYIETGYNELGKYIKYIMNFLKKGKFIKIFQLILLHFKRKRNKTKCNIIKNEQKSTKYIVNSENDAKIVIYTCITGNYDEIEEPLIIESGCDYFLYTNNKELESDIWTIKKIQK